MSILRSEKESRRNKMMNSKKQHKMLRQ